MKSPGGGLEASREELAIISPDMGVEPVGTGIRSKLEPNFFTFGLEAGPTIEIGLSCSIIEMR